MTIDRITGDFYPFERLCIGRTPPSMIRMLLDRDLAIAASEIQSGFRTALSHSNFEVVQLLSLSPAVENRDLITALQATSRLRTTALFLPRLFGSQNGGRRLLNAYSAEGKKTHRLIQAELQLRLQNNQ